MKKDVNLRRKNKFRNAIPFQLVSERWKSKKEEKIVKNMKIAKSMLKKLAQLIHLGWS